MTMINTLLGELESVSFQTDRRAADKGSYKKLAVQQLYEVLYFVSSLVVADGVVLRNRQLTVAAKRQTI